MPMYLTLQVEPDEFCVSAMKNDGTLINTVSIPAKHQEAEVSKNADNTVKAPETKTKKDKQSAKQHAKKSVNKHKQK